MHCACTPRLAVSKLHTPTHGYRRQPTVAHFQAFAIGVPDTVIKLLLGMLHERIWEAEGLRELEYRRAYKTATWKVFAVSSTIAVATYYGNYSFAIKLGPIDTVFKSINYYLHELVWDQIPWGSRHTVVKETSKSAKTS